MLECIALFLQLWPLCSFRSPFPLKQNGTGQKDTVPRTARSWEWCFVGTSGSFRVADLLPNVGEASLPQLLVRCTIPRHDPHAKGRNVPTRKQPSRPITGFIL